jgi:hypothetical protein
VTGQQPAYDWEGVPAAYVIRHNGKALRPETVVGLLDLLDRVNEEANKRIAREEGEPPHVARIDPSPVGDDDVIPYVSRIDPTPLSPTAGDTLDDVRGRKR